MKKIILSLSLIIALCLNGFSQDLSNTLPAEVQKTFNKKFPRAENVNWVLVDGKYKADFFYKEKQSYAEFNEDGSWVITITREDINTVYTPVRNYLDENYPKDKIILIENAVAADKSDYFYVQIEKKIKGLKEKPIFELFFDKSGRFEELRKPEGFNDVTIPGIDERHTEVPEVVIDTWKKKFIRVKTVDWEKLNRRNDTIRTSYVASFIYRNRPTKAEFLESGAWYETRTVYKESELYRPIVNYIYENHYDDELLIAEKVDRADKNNYYYVKLQRVEKGQFHPYIFEIWFNKTGKVTKINRPQELRNQFLVTAELPESVQKKFKGRYARALDVKWHTDGGNYVAEFIYREKPTTAFFSDSAWIKSIEELNPRQGIYAPIDRFLDNQYKKYKVELAEKVTFKDTKKNYFFVKVSSKKEVPEEVDLRFNKSGKLEETIIVR